MVRLELKEMSDDKVVYTYYPENLLDHPGVVGMDRRTEKPLFIQDAVGDPVKMYANQAYLRIRDYARANDFRKLGAVCFY